MEVSGVADRGAGAPTDFHEIVAAIGAARDTASTLAVLALDRIRRGVMTGEGPTTRGRIHFSRTIDATDAAMCELILIAAGGEDGKPVTRQEAEALFEIDEAGLDREDSGHFDDLFVRAVTHHVLSAAGQPVPPRGTALIRSTPTSDWAPAGRLASVDREVADWFAARVRSKKRASAPLETVAALLIGASAIEVAHSLASLLDFAA